MNIQEMHNVFRTLGQQMGIQLIRGILPESIDVFINNVINDTVRNELLTGVHTAIQDSVNTQASTMSPINKFRTLYRTTRYSIDVNNVNINNSKVSFYNKSNSYHILNIPTIKSDIILNDDEYKINPMMYLGFSIEYSNTQRGNAVACRLIGSDVLETTLRDFCNGASKDMPIVSLSSIPIISENVEQLGSISNEQLEVFLNTQGVDIKYLNIKYIKTPNVVKHDVILENCINCDLPEYTHYDIVEQAVRKFYASVGAVQPNQARQQ